MTALNFGSFAYDNIAVFQDRFANETLPDSDLEVGPFVMATINTYLVHVQSRPESLRVGM